MMFDRVYMGVLDMSKTASIVILAVLVVRFLLKKAPKIFSYALWSVVLIRLLCPVGIEASVSLIPELEPVSSGYTLADEPISFAGAGIAAYRAVGDALNGGLGVQHIPTTEKSEDGMTRYVTTDWWSVWILFGKYVWAAGMAAMAFYSWKSYRKIRKNTEIAVPLRENIWIADDIPTPFVIGFIKPKIYLPCNLAEREQEYIILHEQYHIRRFDHILKALAFLALTIHWFNPLVWLAFVLACRDMEMSCDEAVIQKLGGEVRADYSASLLNLATGRRIIAGTPLAFGEGDTKGRVQNLAKWKKPAVWVVVIAVAVCVVLGVGLLTDPAGQSEESSGITWYFGTVEDHAMAKVNETDWEGRSYVTIRCSDGGERLFWLSKGCELPAEPIRGEYVMACVITEYATGLPVVTSIQRTDPSLQDSLENAIRAAIFSHHVGKYYPAECQTADFKLLTQETADSQITCYGIVYYHEYNLTDGVLEGAAGALIPTVLTFQTDEAGNLTLAEYWEPRDGKYYSEDIREKFRGHPWPDTTQYLAEQELHCYVQAADYFGVGMDVVVHSILLDIESSGRWVEGFSDLMVSCKQERKMLSALGTDTLRFCFTEFLEGGYDNLYGQIMAFVCSEIMESMGEKPLEDWSFQQSGQDWFRAFQARAAQLQDFTGDLKIAYPGTYFLLQLAQTGVTE